MKINYYKPDGRRTTITLTDSIVHTWYVTLGSAAADEDKTYELLLHTIENVPHRDNGTTFVRQVESHLLSDVREYISVLERSAFALESEVDGA